MVVQPATPRRGELWWFDPDPVKGSELGQKVRPALVVSVDGFNQGGPKVVVVPGSSRSHPGNPFSVPFTYQWKGRQTTTYFYCDNVRAVDTRARLKSRMGAQPVASWIVAQIERHLRTILGL